MSATIENRKIRLVQNFLILDNKDTISKVELLLENEKRRIFEDLFSKKMRNKQLNQLLDQSEQEFKSGKFYTAEKAKSIIDTW